MDHDDQLGSGIVGLVILRIVELLPEVFRVCGGLEKVYLSLVFKD